MPDITRATPPFYLNQNFGEKFSSALLYSFTQVGQTYYIYIHFIGGHSNSWFSKMRITAKNPMKLTLGDSTITLYPCGTFSGKSTISANYVMGAFYRVEKSDLEYIVSHSVDQFDIAFEALNKDKGKQAEIYEPQQMNDKFDLPSRQEKFMKMAECILTPSKK